MSSCSLFNTRRRHPTVQRRPLLIVPPWINKFYILDLKPKNSFIKWCVEQGHTVFVISWVNPGAELADKSFSDYLLEGPLQAIDAVEKATGESEVNVIGYCIGGTLVASTLAYMAATNDRRIASATLFTSLLDFSDVGDISVFIDEDQLQLADEHMNRLGYLEGHHMAEAFNLMRENDLIWFFVVNNYLLGRSPAAFDLLYWNSDATRMPARMQSFYLRNMYHRNVLKKAGGINLANVPIDLRKIAVPVYFVSTREDHIAPWRSTYAGTQLVSGPVRFILGASGHIAGVINPPSANKYGYWTNEKLSAEPETWLKGATYHEGSWWPDWAKWIAAIAGGQVPARQPGSGKLPCNRGCPWLICKNTRCGGLKLRRQSCVFSQFALYFLELVAKGLVVQQRRGYRSTGDISRIHIAAEMSTRNQSTVSVVLNALVDFFLFFGENLYQHQSDHRTISGVPGRI